MAKYVGVKHNRICVVSDNPFNNCGLDIIEVPAELSHVSSSDLITNCVVRNRQIKCKHIKIPANQLRVAFVGNWKMRCGIATYSESLWPEVAKLVGDYKLFIEKNDITTGDIHRLGGRTIPDNKVVVCWKRGGSLQELVKELKDYCPDVIWIRHEFGLWPNASYWLAMMSRLSDYKVITTMHSVFHHRDKTIVEAAMPEIVVHLDGAKDLLKNEKGVSGKVHVIPHGCDVFDNERLWNFYKSDKTFMQFGFGFRYKGWQNSIKATAILKEKYPDVFFTGLFSESPYAKVEHQMYYNELMRMVEDLGLTENVAIIRGYQSDAAIDSFLRTNQVALFPYVSSPEHEVFGASGAARMAMSKGLPVITSGGNHFSDLPTIKADGPEEIAKALEKLFTEPEAKEKQVKAQISYLRENTWENVAKRYVSIFEE